MKCLTEPGDYALWFMYEPILMSKKSWDRAERRAEGRASMAAGQKAEDFFFEAARRISIASWSKPTKKAGVEVVSMSKDQHVGLARDRQAVVLQELRREGPEGGKEP